MSQPPLLESMVLSATTALLPLLARPSASKSPAPPSSAALLFANPHVGGDGEAGSGVRATGVVSVELDVTFLRAVEPHRVPLYFTLPHAFHTEGICVVTPPPQRRFKDELARCPTDISQAVVRVIDVEKMARKFPDAVSARVFTKAYKTFFVHYNVKRFPAQILSGEFVARRGHPVWMPRRKEGGFEASLRAAMSTAVCPRRGFGNVTVAIGNSSMKPTEIVANAVSFLQQLTSHTLGAPWSDVLVVRLAGAVSDGSWRPALPIWAHDFTVDSPDSFVPEAKDTTGALKKDAPATGKKTPRGQGVAKKRQRENVTA